MEHYIEDVSKKAKAFISYEDGELFVTVLTADEQYDFSLTEKELKFIKYLIELGKENEQ